MGQTMNALKGPKQPHKMLAFAPNYVKQHNIYRELQTYKGVYLVANMCLGHEISSFQKRKKRYLTQIMKII